MWLLILFMCVVTGAVGVCLFIAIRQRLRPTQSKLAKPYELCVVSAIHSENMQEFIEHYTQQGVDHIYFINSGGAHHLPDPTDSSMVTRLADITLPDAYKKIRKLTRWLLIVKGNEFVYGPKYPLNVFIRTNSKLHSMRILGTKLGSTSTSTCASVRQSLMEYSISNGQFSHLIYTDSTKTVPIDMRETADPRVIRMNQYDPSFKEGCAYDCELASIVNYEYSDVGHRTHTLGIIVNTDQPVSSDFESLHSYARIYTTNGRVDTVYDTAKNECTWVCVVEPDMYLSGENICQELKKHECSYELPIYEFWNTINVRKHKCQPLATTVMRSCSTTSSLVLYYTPVCKSMQACKHTRRIEHIQLNHYTLHSKVDFIGSRDELLEKRQRISIPDYQLAKRVHVPKKYKFSVYLDMTSTSHLDSILEFYQNQGVDHVYILYTSLDDSTALYLGEYQDQDPSYVTMLFAYGLVNKHVLYPTCIRNECEWLMLCTPNSVQYYGTERRITDLIDAYDRDAVRIGEQIAIRTSRFESLDDLSCECASIMKGLSSKSYFSEDFQE